MKKITLIISVLIATAFSLTAQTTLPSLVLCSDYDKLTGSPSGIYSNWDINTETGSYIYVIYTQEKSIKDELRLKVERKDESGYYIHSGLYYFTIDTKTGVNWAMYDLLFTQIGDYKLSVLGKSDKVLASTTTNIAAMPASSELGITDSGETDTYYYENSVVRFGTSANQSDLVGETDVFYLNNGVAKFTALLEQDEDLLLTKVYVDIYRGEEVILNTSYTVGDTKWNYITIPVEITEPGSYYMDFYNQNDVFINSGSFTVE